MHTYAYVGPAEIAASVRHGTGTLVRSPADLERFLSGRPDDERPEPFTFVVDRSGTLRLAPRRSEHVACADGEAVRAAGEVGFALLRQGWTADYLSNQSTGYCPDPVESWPAVVAALHRAGIAHGPGFTHPLVHRRCPACGEWNSVRDAHFVCVFCDADLPVATRVGPMDLALLADEEGNAVRITVLGRHPMMQDGVGLAAEIAVETPFVSGRIPLALWRRRLEDWGRALDRLESGEDIAWMAVDRGPSVFIRLTGERDCPEVVVEDETVSMVTVHVPVDLPEHWIARHRERLHDVLTAWNPE
ncbi:DUF5959 family protein [Streptomyces sp. SAS_270]|uniref:DUF5959 family protein n=1 Tax=Streptomyces sp. SAS_270 TaxID=3412748 RepID=UPI00403C3E9E